MALPTPKELKKLADSCRKAGIKHFKCGDVEFTLSDEAPVSNYKKAQAKSEPIANAVDEAFKSDTISEEALLFWSTPDLTDGVPKADQ